MSSPQEIQNYIAQKYPALSPDASSKEPGTVHDSFIDLTFPVESKELLSFLTFLKQDEKLQFDHLLCISGVDETNHLDVVYQFGSYPLHHRVTVKVSLPRENPTIPSATALWPGANWHEREVYDLYGIIFEGHPDLRRILLPDDWEGFPMRKDFRHWNLTPLPENEQEVTKDYPLTPAPVTQKIA